MKGQTSMEFIAFMGVIFLMLTVASYAAIVSANGIAEDSEAADARRIASSVAGEINLAAEIGDGYAHNFYLPELMYDGTDYSLNFTANMFVSVHWKNRSYSLPLLAESITGTAKKGKNVIKNAGGVISFE